MSTDHPSHDELITLVGGPCDGCQVGAGPSGFLHIAISQGEMARFGEPVEEVAVYRLDIAGLRAHYVKRSQA